MGTLQVVYPESMKRSRTRLTQELLIAGVTFSCIALAVVLAYLVDIIFDLGWFR